MQSVSKSWLAKWLILTPFSFVLFTAIAVTLGITAWHLQMRFAGTPKPHGALPPRVRDVIIPVAMIASEWFTLWLWSRHFRSFGTFASVFQTQTTHPWADLAIGVTAGALITLLAAAMKPPAVQWPVVLILFAAVTAGICEELLFRGFLITLIKRAGLGWLAQVGLSAVAFAVGHAYMGPWGIAWAGFVGLVFGSITIWRGSVWATIIAHALVDTCVMLQLISKAGWWRQ